MLGSMVHLDADTQRRHWRRIVLLCESPTLGRLPKLQIFLLSLLLFVLEIAHNLIFGIVILRLAVGTALQDSGARGLRLRRHELPKVSALVHLVYKATLGSNV